MSVPSAPQTSEITVATANTHFGDLIRNDGGLEPFKRYSPDILLLQEVINPESELKEQLSKANYSLVHIIVQFGLAIAVSVGSELNLIPNSVNMRELGKMGPIESTLAQQWARRSHEMSAHGMQAVKFQTKTGHTLTVANTRLTVSSNRLARERQIVKLSQELESPYFEGTLILGGDMNHYPGPKRIDRQMQERIQLQEVELGGEPTWRARNSPLYRFAALVRRQRVENLCAQLDTLLYRSDALEPISAHLIETVSDHRAIVGRFKLIA